MSYRVKSIFYTLQGEGAHAGRPAVFCRFSKCNLWNGREDSRAEAVCNFCDTDFMGTDGPGGGVYPDATSLAHACAQRWPDPAALQQSHPLAARPWLVCTGGEPALQLDEALIEAFHAEGFVIAIETNGTLPLPQGLDWICLSPKGRAPVVLTRCDELKLVYPQPDALPERFLAIDAGVRYLSPMADPAWVAGGDAIKERHTRAALNYCLQHPQWRLSLQTHKLLGID